MKKTIKTLIAFLMVVTLSANAAPSDVKTVNNKAEVEAILKNYEANWNTLAAFTDSKVLTSILNERGVESESAIVRSVIYEKDNDVMMVMLSAAGQLYEFSLSQCTQMPARCGCCTSCNGFAPYDINGDGDCLDPLECQMGCSGPGM